MRQRARQLSGLVESVDIYPTLCELAGLPIRVGLDGSSFASVLNESSAATKEAIFHVYPRQKMIGQAVRTARYRLIEWKSLGGAKPGPPVFELYDYETDPAETKNLAAKRPDMVAELREILAQQPEARPQLSSGKPAKKARAKNVGLLRAESIIRATA